MSSLIESKVSAIKLKRKVELKFIRVLRQDLFLGLPSFTPISAAHTPAHILINEIFCLGVIALAKDTF